MGWYDATKLAPVGAQQTQTQHSPPWWQQMTQDILRTGKSIYEQIMQYRLELERLRREREAARPEAPPAPPAPPAPQGIPLGTLALVGLGLWLLTRPKKARA